MRSSLVFSLGCLLFALVGCSDDADPLKGTGASGAGASGSGASGGGGAGAEGGGGTGNAGGCAELDVSLTQIYRYTDAFFSVQANVAPEVEGAYRSLAVIELYNDWISPDLPPLATGSFDLAGAPNDAYSTCQHCVTVITPDSSEIPTRTFFQTSGTIELEKLDEFDNRIAAGTLSDVTLSEVAQAEDGSWEPVPDGACFVIPSWSFDTTPVDGIPCEKAEDCGNTSMQVCSPKTGTCEPYECLFTFDVLCPDGELCVAQVPSENSIGACYTTCAPGTSGDCPAGEACMAVDPVQDIGICRPPGEGTPGEACTEPDLSTGCEVGSLCAGVPATCAQTCAYLTPDPGCPDGSACHLTNVCLPPAAGDSVAIGETCAPSWVEYRGCGNDGEAFRGLCLSLYPEIAEETCYRTCRVDEPDCLGGEYCAGIFSNAEVGLCWAIPTCGDGTLDPLNEVCDDGNAESGDGCAGDCDSAEFDALCDDAEPLLLDVDIDGTTVGGPTGYGGSCELYVTVPTKTYSFAVPGPGRLSLSLESTLDLDLVAASDCADPLGSELACRSTPNVPEFMHIDFADAQAEPALIMVRAFSIADAGAFTLHATFIPAVCGDGEVVGPEVCDDGGAGFCEADCLATKWPELCDSLPTLSTSAANTDDTSTAHAYASADGFCTFESGNEVMYSYVAPKAGTLTLHLDEPGANHAVYVIDGCLAPASYDDLLACSNFGTPPSGHEEAQITLAAGQEVTVVIDTFGTTPGGPFSLEATFQ
jgi:cysteine-rich repeat protein